MRFVRSFSGPKLPLRGKMQYPDWDSTSQSQKANARCDTRPMAKSATDKLKELVEKRGRVSVLQDTGLSKQYLSNLLTGQKPFALNARTRFEEALGLPEGYFSVDSVDMGSAMRAGYLPVIRAEDIGRIDLDSVQERVFFDARLSTAGSYMLLIEGDSMVSPSSFERSLPPGAHVAVNPDAEAKTGDFVVAKHPGALQPVVRKLISDSGQLYLVALNPKYGELVKVTKDVQILGRVMGVVALL